MKETIKACLNAIGNNDADLSLFKDRKWLTQKLNGLNIAIEHLSISEENIAVFQANVNLFLEKTESKSTNAEIRAAIKELVNNIDLMTGYKRVVLP